MSKGKCRSCKFDMSDDQGVFRTSSCPDYLDGKITDGCEFYEPDNDMILSLKEQEKKERQEAKERAKYRKKKDKAETKAYNGRYRRKKCGMSNELKRLLGLIVGIIVVLASIFYLTSNIMTQEVEQGDDEPNRATENITEMIMDLSPTFVILVFVMVFMLMLLTIVDRIGKGY